MENQREKKLKSEMDTVLLQVECYGILGQARIKAGSLGLGFRGLSQEGHLSWNHLLAVKPLTVTSEAHALTIIEASSTPGGARLQATPQKVESGIVR